MNKSFDPLKVARAPKLREAAYSAIKEAIFDARLAAGEPLFEERIAAALGISRTPVREALAILEHEGLIAARQGKGLFIRELTREEFLDMFGANEVIEPYLARRAALRATGEHIDQIQAAIDGDAGPPSISISTARCAQGASFITGSVRRQRMNRCENSLSETRKKPISICSVLAIAS